MTTATPFLSPYDQRLKLVKNIVTTHSKIDDVAASEIAVLVLRALDTIPEKVR